MDPLSRNPFIMQDCMPPVLPPPRSYYVVSWVPRALPEVVQLVKEIPNDAERSLINDHYELGMLVMRRCGVQNPEEIKCLLDGFREGTTRLAVKSNRNNNNNTELVQDGYWRHAGGAGPPVLERRKLLIFFNDHRASRPWVLCPAKHCIKSARTTGKVKGRVKIFQFDPRTCTAEVPKLFINCLADFMTADHYVFATFCPQQKYTDHELGWFDTSRKRFPGERGGDTVYRELLEDYDMKSAGRVWPFDDYIIFSNSQSKILGVFRKKQVPVYSRTTTSGSGEQALIDQNDDDRRSAGNPGMAAWECSSSSMAKHAEDVLVKIMARVLAHLDPCETSVPRSQTNNNNNQDTTNSIPSYGKIKSETTDDLPDNQSCCRDQDDQSCCSDDAGSSSTCRQKDGSSEPPSFGGVKRRRYSQVHSVPACIIGGGSSVSNGNTAAGLVIAPPSSQQQQPPQQQQQSAPIPPTVLTPKGLGPIRPPPCTHELVSQFINAVMVGLDQVQPCALRRVPEPIKRIVMKLITDNIREINLALLAACPKRGTSPHGPPPPPIASLMRLTSSGGAEIQQCYPNGSTNGQGPTNFFGFRSSNGVHPGQESQCDVGQQQPPLGETSNLGGAPYSHHMYGNTGIPGRPTFHQPPLCPPSLDNIVERGWSTGGWPASFYGNNDHLMMLQQQQVVTQESTIEENSHHLHLENKVGSAGSASASTCETLYYERPGHLLMQSEAALQSPEDGCEEAFECSAEAALMTGGGLGSCSSLLEVQPQ